MGRANTCCTSGNSQLNTDAAELGIFICKKLQYRAMQSEWRNVLDIATAIESELVLFHKTSGSLKASNSHPH
jgi:hypothetical protein